ncbi:MAG: hypothetical protein KC410_00380 [Anaerolineales bacterium]|nr:hypothetical protein [Anaerolineales bacterium]
MNQARRALVEVVQLAAPEGFIRPFVDFGSPLAPLLSLVAQEQNLSAEAMRFIDEVLRLLGQDAPKTDFLPLNSLESLAMAASITPREHDVLRLVSEGLSNRQIALKLCVSPGTVKTHLANIYSKLDVNSRTQAIAEAQTLKLI